MYKILIVDDEKKEREGIALLIKRYGYDLKVSLAGSGEEALKFMEREFFDILLTDIKMPHMDGITLIREAQKRGSHPICIIYSAYGEFEYAQNAISLGVLEYLLKPVRLEAFAELFERVIGMCISKEKDRQEKKKIIYVQEEAEYLKKSRDLLNFLEWEEVQENQDSREILDRMKEELSSCINFDTDVCIPVILSCFSNLFAIWWDKYRKEIEDQLGGHMMIINNTDNQVIILLIRKKGEVRFSEVRKRCEALLEASRERYQLELFLVLGEETQSLDQLRKEYGELKEQLDYQFFVSRSVLMVRDEFFSLKKENSMLELYLEKIYNCAKMSDYRGIRKELEKVFAYVEKQTGFSSIYIKYTFTDLLKKICDHTKSGMNLVACIEQIYQAKSMGEVKRIMFEALDEMEKVKCVEAKENRLVRMTKNIIHEKYGENDLNVSYIADELHVSSAYLSSLYKIETGQNLVKYITWYRIEKSKELLKQTNLKISDVAERVGYLNVSYYISIFRNYEGCSPVQFREKE